MLFSTSNVAAQESEGEFSEEFVEYIMGYVDNIKHLLEQAKEEYANGNVDKAHSLATEAYIDNYEFIEWELAQYDEELIEEVEWMMREELRSMIKEGAPVSDVNAKIDTILIKMDSIAAIVPEFGIFTILILVIGILGAVVVSSKNSKIIPRC
ncbi:MAG: PEFG-CTERM sorting domain-containing protein [Nitrosopumilaceae archaeon]|nr:PEFG-CTERM sorting domain-containing protein [Nitrosopumilaceae archaeon]NIU00041.1 PEFG-CTERM sorting domain-containing protein [Nitrosopumilaceae archaeon]NIU86420.1 PEFG-CTERM sorting domain-containing protein [Nitrosopumilaceae archaeon]NIV65129.1 PEFG-CTERM sorting domain-containing protein [Nitrosopumilaceae archaeon]NIX60643.1 PEFG-CTERM sorting domain-containing protein [Nitrosopumilaceae archaeon]